MYGIQKIADKRIGNLALQHPPLKMAVIAFLRAVHPFHMRANNPERVGSDPFRVRRELAISFQPSFLVNAVSPDAHFS